MDSDKRKIIVNEIQRWRSSKLLPEHYCDFLLNLYVDNSSGQSGEGKATSFPLSKMNWKMWAFIIVLISLITLIIPNFNSFTIQMQVGIAIVFVLLCFIIGGAKRTENVMVSYLFFAVGSLFLLFIGIYMMNLYGISESGWIIAYIVFCCIVWIGIGLGAHMWPFHLCGWVGLMLVYGLLLSQHTDHEMNWFEAQMYWVPISFIFIWITWLLHHKDKSAAVVFFIIGCFLWFAPEVFALYGSDFNGIVLQIFIVGKVIIEGIVLFGWRKKWIEWVK